MMRSDKQTTLIPCPDCEQDIFVGIAAKEGDQVTCPHCWAYLVVVSLNPLELAWDMEDLEELGDEWDIK